MKRTTQARDVRRAGRIEFAIACMALMTFAAPQTTAAEQNAAPKDNAAQQPAWLPSLHPQLVEEYERAVARASRSEPGSALALARMLDYGLGTKVDTVKAIELYKIAVAEKSASAARSLGAIYAIGDGVPRNVQEASEWFKTAKSLGGSYPCFAGSPLMSDTETAVALCAISALTRSLVVYPDEARRLNHSGSVHVGVNFKRLEIRVVESDAGPVLEASAKADIKRFIKVVPLPDALLGHDEEIIFTINYVLSDRRGRALVERAQKN